MASSPGFEIHVDVDRRRPPVEQHRAGTADQVDATAHTCPLAERSHEQPKPGGVGQLTHSPARSKLTSVRMSALYREWAESASDFASSA